MMVQGSDEAKHAALAERAFKLEVAAQALSGAVCNRES